MNATSNLPKSNIENSFLVYNREIPKIYTLNELIKKIQQRARSNPHLGAIAYSDLLLSYVGEDYTHFVTFDEATYTRKILLDKNNLKVVLIGWNPSQSSPLHGHKESSCIFKVLDNRVTEMRMTNEDSEILSSSIIYAAGMALINDFYGFHIIENPTDLPSVSLHIYTN